MLQMVDKAPYDFGPKYGYAAGFFRANEDARFTQSHDAHGDTEYQYDIVYAKDSQEGSASYLLIAKEVDCAWSENKLTITTFFEGKVEDFIQRYTENEEVTPTEGYILYWITLDDTWIEGPSFPTYDAAKEYAEKEKIDIWNYDIQKICVQKENL